MQIHLLQRPTVSEQLNQKNDNEQQIIFVAYLSSAFEIITNYTKNTDPKENAIKIVCTYSIKI